MVKLNSRRSNPLSKFFGSFPVLESKVKEWPIICMDTEDDSKGTTILYGFHGDFKEKNYVTRHAEEALSFIYDIEEPTIFVTHNLEYDIANLFKDSDYLVVDRMVYASSLLKVDLAGTQHFFLNTHSYFKGSLAAMAKFVGLKKLDGDPFSEEYVLKDCEIAYKFTKMFQTKLMNEVGVNLGVTIGKMSMDTYRRNYMLKKQQVTYCSPKCLKAYYGGRVEIFRKGEQKDINVIDINSAYPYVMREYEYPDTSTIEPSRIATHHFGIGEFTMFVPKDTFLPVLPHKVKAGGRLYFPTGKFKGWWTYAEVRYAVKCGAKIIKEHRGEGTNFGCSPFQDFIDTFYAKRQDAKARLRRDKHDIQAIFDDLFYKFWLNNLYGKWNQNKPGSEMTRDRWPFYKLEKNRENENFKECKVGPFYCYTVPKTEPPKTANFMWGTYVTSYARIHLHKGLEDIRRSGHTLLYCDTDSIMYHPVNNSLPVSITNKLGDWDMENFDLGIFRQAKGYLLLDKEGSKYTIKKVACKGVPQKHAYDFIIDGMATFRKPMRLKEGLIRTHAAANKNKSDAFLKEMGENFWGVVQKEMKSVYIKRKGETITYPVDISEIPDLEANSMIDSFSIKEELAKNDIQIKKPIIKDNFANTIIPDDWFIKKGTKTRKPRFFVSQKVHNFRSVQCVDLGKGDMWFRGDILQMRTNVKGKQFYRIFVTNYKGKELNAHFWGQIPVSFFEDFGIYENLMKKNVALKMDSNYFVKKLPDFSIDISESKKESQINTEIIDEEKPMTKKELENLMAFDWSKIACPK